MNINHLFTKSDLVFINVLFDFYIKNLSEEYKKGDNLKSYEQILSIRDKCINRLNKRGD